MKNRFPLIVLLEWSAVFVSAWLVAAVARGQGPTTAAGGQSRATASADQGTQSIPPELEQVLEKWEQSSGQIRTLQGKHYRWVYDTVFNVEKRSQGVFYYEAPDKGRIDFEGRNPLPGETSRRVDPRTGKPFEIRADQDEIWICDGQAVWQINPEQKTAERFEIPPEHRGKNIMDGPLPFLFGMPAEKAKQRYWLSFLRDPEQTGDEIWLRVIPRWQQDAANYREADIILDKKTYLPKAVRLIDPAGTKETVFRFEDLKLNQRQSIFQKLLGNRDPFKPNLRGYKIANRSVSGPGSETPSVPSVVGLHWQVAAQVLERSGYIAKYHRGEPATRSELVYVVYQQNPAPRTPAPKGSVVELTLYDKMPGSSSSSGNGAVE